MEKKYACILAAVLWFFGGAVWVSEAPIVAPLVAFLEVAGGFVCGFFFKKFQNQVAMEALNEEVESLHGEISSLKDSIKKLKAEKEVTKTATKPKKNKE